MTTPQPESAESPPASRGLRNGGAGQPPTIVKPWVSILRAVVGLVIVGVAVGALLLWALEPSSNDGAPQFVALVGIPLGVTALTIQMIAHNSITNRRTRFNFLCWLFAALPGGLLAASLPSVLANPDYFGSASICGVLGALAMNLVLILLGYGFGALAWFFVVWPLFQLVGTVIRMVRGEKRAAVGLLMPLVLLTLSGVILVGAGALDLSDAGPGRFAWPQILLALLGIPGNYGVESEFALWIVRLMILGVTLLFVVPWLLSRRAERFAGLEEAEEAKE